MTNQKNKIIKGRSLTKCIGKAFYNVHNDIKQGKHTYYDLTNFPQPWESCVLVGGMIFALISGHVY